MKSRSFTLLGMSLALAGCMAEGQTSGVGRGSSTATITQDDGAMRTITRTTSGPEGQTIVRRQGGSTAIVRQNTGADTDDASVELRASDSFRSRFLNRMAHD